MAWAAVHSGAVVLLLLICCLMYFPLFVGVLCLSLFCYALLCVHSSIAIILKRKRKLVALLLLSDLLSGRGFCLQCVIVVFPDHTHLHFNCTYMYLYGKIQCPKLRL